jgi:O-antigen/teichoic acid export membrane protein
MPSFTGATRKPASLRVNVTAVFAGNAVFALSQWAVLSILAKLGSAEMLGQYALAMAVAGPVALFAHLNLRAVLATDVERRHPFGDYLAVRLATVALGMAAVAAIALASGYGWPVAPVIVLAGFALSMDNLSDVYYGLLQRRERMDRIAASMMARGLVSVAALAGALWLTGSLPAAVAALAGARLAVFFAYDRPVASAGEPLERSGFDVQLGIFRTALPLGIVLMLASLTVNLPRYAIEGRLGTAELGAFAAVAAFVHVGSTVVNALGHAATPRLARFFSEGDLAQFRALAWKLALLALLLGAAGVLAAAALGPFVLGLAYRPAYAAYSGLLVLMMAAGVLSYMAGILGYLLTSTRSFAAQAPLLAAAAGAAAAGSWALVPMFGLNGAALALGAAWAVQICGQLVVLRRTLRRRELRF